MRQIILDTETTGLEAAQGHRIIEIGCVELVSRRVTGRRFHKYIDPERDIDEGAQAVHGISRAQLAGEPKFREIAPELIEFIAGAELVIHNAAFDVGFLDAELARLEGGSRRVADLCRVLDTLALARSLHPGQRNSLDALCKRYGVDNSGRDLHGALLDAQLLADVYLAMTGGQSTLALHDEGTQRRHEHHAPEAPRWARPSEPLIVRAPSDAELAAHEALLERVAKASGGKVLFRQSCDPGRADPAA